MTVQPVGPDRDSEYVTFRSAPECETHRMNYDESVPAAFHARTGGELGTWHYLCNECHTFFCDRTSEGEPILGKGKGQRIRVNSAAQPAPRPGPWAHDEGWEPPAKPAKKAAAPRVPTIAEAAERQAAKNAAAQPAKQAAPRPKGAAKKAAMNKAPAPAAPPAPSEPAPAVNGAGETADDIVARKKAERDAAIQKAIDEGAKPVLEVPVPDSVPEPEAGPQPEPEGEAKAEGDQPDA